MARFRNKNKKMPVKAPVAKKPPSVDHLTGEKIPKSFVFLRGKVPGSLKQLELDLRKVMLPHTALRLKEILHTANREVRNLPIAHKNHDFYLFPKFLVPRWIAFGADEDDGVEKRRNNLKDFLNVAGPMGVTHFLILSKPKSVPHLRVARTPQGPTLTFEIQEYALAADLARAQTRPRCPQGIFNNSPLIVLSGFGSGGQHLKLTTIMFQNIFPAIDINTVKLSSCQRIVLLNYNSETKLIDFRHYSIRLQPVGVSRRIRKFVQNHHVPDLRSLEDVSDFVTKAGYGSESEADEESATVSLATDLGRVNRASMKSAVKLQEIGPRMTLRLVKIEEGLCSGGVIFSQYAKDMEASLGSHGEDKQAATEEAATEEETLAD